jgi:hypothetical protein
MEFQKLLTELSKEIVGMYDAAEDIGESKLVDAMGEANESHQSDLSRKVFEGTIEMVIEELLTGEVGLEVMHRIVNFRLSKGDI